MVSPNKQIHLVATLPAGREVSANTWRLPGSPITTADRLRDNIATLKAAEKGKFDAVIYADIIYGDTADYWTSIPPVDFEPLTLLSLLSTESSHIGLVASLSTTYDNPYQVARRILSLDHLSNGRAGWNSITSFNAKLADAYGIAALDSHRDRYRRAAEFTDIVRSLWGSFGQGSTRADRATSVFTDPAKISTTDFAGEFLHSRGLLGASASPQGRPVVFQAGASVDSIGYAARHAEAVFTSQKSIAGAHDFVTRLRAESASIGRAQAPKILTGLNFLIAETEQAVRELEDVYLRAVVPSVFLGGAYFVSEFFTEEAKAYILQSDLDAPLPAMRDSVEGYQSAHASFRAALPASGATVGDFLRIALRSQFTYLAGTPEQIARNLQAWVSEASVDGFVLVPFHQSTEQVSRFAEHVVPLLQSAGLFRTDYQGATLRDHLQLS